MDLHSEKVGLAVIISFFLVFGASPAQAYKWGWQKKSHAIFTNQKALEICKNDKRRPKGSVCKRPTDIKTERTCDKPKSHTLGVGAIKVVYFVSHCDLRYVEIDPKRPSVHVVVWGCRLRTTIGLIGGALGRCEGGRTMPYGFADWKGEGYI